MPTADDPQLPAGYLPRIHRAQVTAVRQLTPGLVRVTLGGPDLTDYPTTGIGDEYVRLFFPDTPDSEPRLPHVTDRGWEWDEGVEPAAMRVYTVRHHRAGEVDLDFVVHEGGIAAAWAQQVAVGQVVGLNAPYGLYDPPAGTTRQVLVADEPALPAALRIAEATADRVATTLLLEVRGSEHQLQARVPDGAAVEHVWLRGSGNGHSPSHLVEALRRTEVTDTTYVWVASETRENRAARRYLRHDLGLPGDRYKCVGYWTERAEEWRERYDALGPDFSERLDALWADETRDTEEIVDEVQRLYEAVGL
ncbi:NADPH-dependent ferric siderophore reductase [Nocardioides zeae]|uniref:NADPH-dependent ferric siderophore reductase n=1 Tax=Nocardioides zeae TaxID=1457234 RepID=A0ACC6ILP0_9ACTN|nr:siderophore-interacting protein [Nocardioides zeae]MDR6175093.1 NADPH-dependent ferric siderophore reductase [Nocardioides zeae]MDR6211671.1 NADPH-dependent ferric siderophore reductase [Nocardioides zeae]